MTNLILLGALLAAVLAGTYAKGYNSAEEDYELKIAKINTAYQVELDAALKKNFELTGRIDTIKSEANVKYNEAIDQVNTLQSSLARRVNDPRVRHRNTCVKANTSGMSKDSDPEVHNPTEGQFELSEEFRNFLLSSFRRADELNETTIATRSWAENLCENKLAICE